jgi:hypothetical protein
MQMTHPRTHYDIVTVWLEKVKDIAEYFRRHLTNKSFHSLTSHPTPTCSGYHHVDASWNRVECG